MQLCRRLESFNLLQHPCPFHSSAQPTFRKRWRKRGRRGLRKPRVRNIPVITNNRTKNHVPGQNSANSNNLRILNKYNSRKLNIKLWNARSVRKKTVSIADNIIENDVDIFVITETWLASDDPVVIGEMLPPGYSFINFPRKSDEHGGIGIIHKTHISMTIVPTTSETTNFEYAIIVVNNTGLRLVIVYRPPPSTENGLKTSKFLEEFECFLDDINLAPAKTVLLGDFNVHVDTPWKSHVARFLDALTSHDLHQYVQETTHKDGHILDLIISRVEDKLISECCVLPSLGSDHKLIDCVIEYAKPLPPKLVSNVRNYKNMDKSKFSNDLATAIEGLDFRGTVDVVLEQFDSCVKGTLDSHAPSQTRTRSLRPRFPWYNEEINDERCKRRKLERKWRKSKQENDHTAYIDQSNKVNNLIQSAKEIYYNEELKSADCKNTYSILNRLLNNNVKSLPNCDSMSELSNSFANFFINKVTRIRQELINVTSDNQVNSVGDNSTDTGIPSFDCFRPVSADDIEKTILGSANKSCMLDTLPMWLFKDNVNIMCNVLMQLANKSFSTGEFPSQLREAIVCPVLKKATLDKNVLQNYRPVSNIRYYSKIMEKIAAAQLQDHLRANNLLEEFQSAYRAQHSTETALLRVKTDILTDMDNGKAVFVVLLDLSAAFDTVDHQILLDRLSSTFSITGTALRWISSYLSDRYFRVTVGGDLSVSGAADGSSDKFDLKFGVPQGSVLGPLFFVLYTSSIGDILRKHNINYHIYADDIQLYLAFDPNESGAAISALTRLSFCINDIHDWMTKNMLKLNNSKTEFFLAASQHNLKKLRDVSLHIGDIQIYPASKIRNLGVIFDQTMSMKDHVNTIVRTVNFHLRKPSIGSIACAVTFGLCKLSFIWNFSHRYEKAADTSK